MEEDPVPKRSRSASPGLFARLHSLSFGGDTQEENVKWREELSICRSEHESQVLSLRRTIKELREENQALHAKKQQSTDPKRDTLKELERISEDYERLQYEYRTLRQKADLTEEKQQLEDEQVKTKNLVDIIHTKNSTIAKMKATLDQYAAKETEMKKAGSTLIRTRQERDGLIRQQSAAVQQIEVLSRQNTDLLDQLRQSKVVEEEMREQIQLQQAKVQQFDIIMLEREDAQQRYHEAKSKVTMLEEEMTHHRNELKEYIIKYEKKQREEDETEQMLQLQRRLHEEECSSLEQEVARLKKGLEKEHDMVQKYVASEAKLKQLELIETELAVAHEEMTRERMVLQRVKQEKAAVDEECFRHAKAMEQLRVRINELEWSTNDLELHCKGIKRSSEQLIKELKTELRLEKIKSSDLLGQVKELRDNLSSRPTLAQVSAITRGSVSSTDSSVAFYNLESTLMNTSQTSLIGQGPSADIDDEITTRFTALQRQNFEMKQNRRYLEETLQNLLKTVQNKDTALQNLLRRIDTGKLNVLDPQVENPVPYRDRLEAVLQKTLVENTVLQDQVDVLGRNMTKLFSESRRLQQESSPTRIEDESCLHSNQLP